MGKAEDEEEIEENKFSMDGVKMMIKLKRKQKNWNCDFH